MQKTQLNKHTVLLKWNRNQHKNIS